MIFPVTRSMQIILNVSSRNIDAWFESRWPSFQIRGTLSGRCCGEPRIKPCPRGAIRSAVYMLFITPPFANSSAAAFALPSLQLRTLIMASRLEDDFPQMFSNRNRNIRLHFRVFGNRYLIVSRSRCFDPELGEIENSEGDFLRQVQRGKNRADGGDGGCGVHD